MILWLFANDPVAIYRRARFHTIRPDPQIHHPIAPGASPHADYADSAFRGLTTSPHADSAFATTPHADSVFCGPSASPHADSAFSTTPQRQSSRRFGLSWLQRQSSRRFGLLDAVTQIRRSVAPAPVLTQIRSSRCDYIARPHISVTRMVTGVVTS